MSDEVIEPDYSSYVEEVVAHVEANSGKSTPINLATLVEALAGWMYTDVAEYTEGAQEAVSRRMAWVYPDGLMVTIGTDITTTVSAYNEKLTADSIPPIYDMSDVSKWVFMNHANGWQSVEGLEAIELVTLVKTLEVAHGVPKLVLPWESWTENSIDAGEDFYDYYEPEEESYKVRKSFIAMAELITEAKLDEFSPWTIELTYDDEYMSQYSDYIRFYEFLGRLEASKHFIVQDNEHCASCSRGTYESIVGEDEELVGKPSFVIWGQNSQGNWMPDGAIYVNVYVDDPEDEKFAKQLATDSGLDVGDINEHTGDISFES